MHGEAGREARPGDREAKASQFCRDILPSVSRTFALSIEALPGELREPVRLSYLLCRLVDTLEDDSRLAPEDQQALFDRFEELLAPEGPNPGHFEQTCTRLEVGGSAAEQQLCRRAGAVFAGFRSLPVAQQEAIRPPVMRMARGMREYAARAAAGGRLQLVDRADLERYCYFVAGTVGELLTALFLEVVPVAASLRRELEQRSVAFGLGLQLVNIVKDVAEDAARNCSFVPRELLARHGLAPEQLLEPEHRPAGLAVVGELCRLAREHLEQAEQYTLGWPLPAGLPIRLFCAVPLALARATLQVVEQGDDTLRPGRTPKVSRAQVARVLLQAHRAAGDDGALRQLLQGG